MATPEGKFKAEFKKELVERLAKQGVEIDIFENKSNKRSSLDTIFLGKCVWAMLEFKASKDAPHRPNQDYNVDRMNERCYAAFVYPENKQEKLDELERLFSITRNSCVPLPVTPPLVRLRRDETGRYIQSSDEGGSGDEIS